MISHRTPRKAAYLQITRECNNECIFCSNPQFHSNKDFEDLKKDISKFKKMGITDINFTGGEPTIVSFLPKLISYSINQGIKPNVITNGVNLSDLEYVKSLFDAGLRNINISIHSHDQNISDNLNDSFNCYGIDNYNQYNKNKISDLHELAEYYLKLIQSVSHSSEYVLCGWSLGGQIALQIAANLEEKK